MEVFERERERLGIEASVALEAVFESLKSTEVVTVGSYIT